MLMRILMTAALGVALASPAAAQDSQLIRRLSNTEISEAVRGRTADSTGGGRITYGNEPGREYTYSNPRAYDSYSSGTWEAKQGKLCRKTGRGENCDEVWVGADGRLTLLDAKGQRHVLTFITTPTPTRVKH